MADEWNAKRMLDSYILEYMRKKNMHVTAEIFNVEANVSEDAVELEAPGGFLKEWWDMFYDVYNSGEQTDINKNCENSLKDTTAIIDVEKTSFPIMGPPSSRSPSAMMNIYGPSGPSDKNPKTNRGSNARTVGQAWALPRQDM